MNLCSTVTLAGGVSIRACGVLKTCFLCVIGAVVFVAVRQAAWSPQSAGAQSLRASDPEKFQVYADGGTMVSQEVRVTPWAIAC